MSGLEGRPPPSTAAIAIATAIIAGLTGYFVGQAASLGLFQSAPAAIHESAKHEDPDDSSDDELDEQGEIKSFAGNNEECKLVLVVRTDLGITKGNSSSMLPRHARMLQDLLAQFPQLPDTPTMGKDGAGQGGTAD